MSCPRGALGRPTKLDDLVAKRIVDAVRAGHSYAAAARAGRIDEATLHRWLARGRDGEAPYRAFCERFDEADHEAENRAIDIVVSKFDSVDPRVALTAAQWWLARRRPVQWGEKQTTVSPGEVSGEQTADDLDVARAVVSALESRKAG